MILDNLYLEITRNCTIECEHCLRGKRECSNMSLVTLENTLKEIKEIKHLLLSGGEPLINITILENLPILLNKYNIKVDKISLITNGTIKSERHIKALENIEDCCGKFNFVLSNDLFHKLEWKRLGIEDRIKRNYEEFKERFDIDRYPYTERYHRVSLAYKGRAKNLTKTRIDEITKDRYINYYFVDIPIDDNLSYTNDRVSGKICIDVNGNIVDYSMTFDEEDEFANNGFNVNIFPFNTIVKEYIDDYKDRNYGYRKKLVK